MATFGNTVNIRGISEERGFTNPHVRFRRINGRIVPIINKKRIGQDTSSAGESLIKAGAAASAVGLAKTSTKYKAASAFLKRNSFKAPKFKFKTSAASSMKKKVAISAIKAASKAAKFGFKNAGKLGLAGIAAGLATKIVGDEIQMQSPFGKDFVFIKDRSGRGS